MHPSLNRKGFTLLELVVSLCIIFILIALIVPVFSNYGEKSSAQVYEAEALMIYTNVNQILFEDISIKKENIYECKDGCKISSLAPSTPSDEALITRLNDSFDNLNGSYVIDYDENNLTVYFFNKDNKTSKYDGIYSTKDVLNSSTTSSLQTTTTTTITTSSHETTASVVTSLTSSTKRTSTTKKEDNEIIDIDAESERWILAMLYGFSAMYENADNPDPNINGWQFQDRCSYSYQKINNLPDEEKLTLFDLTIINSFESILIQDDYYQFDSNKGTYNCKNKYNDRVQTFPELFTQITSIETVAIYNSPKLQGQLPTDFSKLTKLKNFTLGRVNIEGPLPDSLFELASLEEVYLSNTKINYIPDTILNKLSDPSFSFQVDFLKDNNYPMYMSKAVYEALVKHPKSNFHNVGWAITAGYLIIED